jgi:hypothetical protein
VACFKALHENSPGRTENNHRKNQGSRFLGRGLNLIPPEYVKSDNVLHCHSEILNVLYASKYVNISPAFPIK